MSGAAWQTPPGARPSSGYDGFRSTAAGRPLPGPKGPTFAPGRTFRRASPQGAAQINGLRRRRPPRATVEQNSAYSASGWALFRAALAPAPLVPAAANATACCSVAQGRSCVPTAGFPAALWFARQPRRQLAVRRRRGVVNPLTILPTNALQLCVALAVKKDTLLCSLGLARAVARATGRRFSGRQ